MKLTRSNHTFTITTLEGLVLIECRSLTEALRYIELLTQ